MEAALLPIFRYVKLKAGDLQSRSILCRTGEQFVKQ